MTGLLVSVRDVAEADSALRGGADLIDIKEPSLGALGAAGLEVVSAVFDFVDGRVPVSAACGELLDEMAYPPGRLPALSFAKIGLAGCSNEPAWESRLAAAWQQFSPTVGRVAVAYADWYQCHSLPPNIVIEKMRTESLRSPAVGHDRQDEESSRACFAEPGRRLGGIGPIVWNAVRHCRQRETRTT